MKIKNSKTIELISSLMERIDISSSISEMFLAGMEYSQEYPLVLDKSEDEQSQLIDHLNEAWEIDFNNPENKEIANKLIFPNIKKLTKKDYENNPYYQRVRIRGIKYNNYELINDVYLPYEIFSYNDITVDNEYYEHCHIGYFDESFPFITLNKDKVTWMNITPNEINTMQKAVDEAKGKVLVFGLGLGYYPFMISLKDNAKEITIIEKDKDIIELFTKYLLPQFPHIEKIHIIEKDALSVDANYINQFDYVFIDLWHNPVDGLPFYKHFKKLEAKLKSKFFYWLEDSFIAYLRRLVVLILYDYLDDPSIRYDNSEEGKLLNELKRKIDFDSLLSPGDVITLISRQSLLSLLLS